MFSMCKSDLPIIAQGRWQLYGNTKWIDIIHYYVLTSQFSVVCSTLDRPCSWSSNCSIVSSWDARLPSTWTGSHSASICYASTGGSPFCSITCSSISRWPFSFNTGDFIPSTLAEPTGTVRKRTSCPQSQIWPWFLKLVILFRIFQAVSEGSQMSSHDQFPPSQSDQNLLRSNADYNYEISSNGQALRPDYLDVHISQGVQPDSVIQSSTDEAQVVWFSKF